MEQKNSFQTKIYVLSHNIGEPIEVFLADIRIVTNKIIEDIWNSITWKEVPIRKKTKKANPYYRYNQSRLFPHYEKGKEVKNALRKKHLNDWQYSSHWIDSSLKTAFAIMESWKKNYKKGNRKRNIPVVKREFVRVKQTLMKIKKNSVIRISIKPREFIIIPIDNRYFKMPANAKIGEPILTPSNICIPITREVRYNVDDEIGWDSNLWSMDGFSEKRGWIRIDTKPLYTMHIAMRNKKSSLQSHSKTKKGKRTLSNYRHREHNKTEQMTHAISNTIVSFKAMNGMENLHKTGMFTNNRNHNHSISHADWMAIQYQVNYKSLYCAVEPENTSRECSRCGYINKR